MGRYPKNRGDGWTRRKSGNTNGSNIDEKKSIERKKEYKNKHKIKSKIINELNIKNIKNIQQQNDHLSKETVYNLKQQINDLKNNNNDCDLCGYVMIKKWFILHLFKYMECVSCCNWYHQECLKLTNNQINDIINDPYWKCMFCLSQE